MCKIFALTNSSKVKIDTKLIESVRDAVCDASDRDGFGYASLNDNQLICGERTTKPFEWSPFNRKTSQLSIVSSPSCNSFGDLASVKDSQVFIGHGRFSTNSKTLANTHPFVSDTLAMIHNGVVQQVGPKIDNLKTDCDTEILFHHWKRSEMHDIEDQVSGYYAMAVIDSETQLLHIVRDSAASLYIAWSASVESFVIATTVEIIWMVAEANNWAIETPEKISDNLHVIFKGNEIISQKPIQPLGRLNTQFDSKLTAEALGTVTVDKYEGFRDSPEVYSDPESDTYLTELEEEYYRMQEEALANESEDDIPFYRRKTG